MDYRIVHELPDRIRVHLLLPGRAVLDFSEIEAHFEDLAGIVGISSRPRTRNLLIRYDGKKCSRAELLERVETAPHPGRRRRRIPAVLDRKKKTVVRSGALLLARPLIPPPLRPFFAIYGAMPIFRRGASSLWNRRLNVDVLDSAAIGAAMANRDFLTASIISFLLKLGDYLEEWTRKRSRKLLTEMFHVEAEWAWVLRDGQEVRLPLEEVVAGDTVVVRTGGLIPVDGLVLDGEAMVNQASLTGESLAVFKNKKKSVYAGTAVEEGLLRVEAMQVGTSTRAARVVKIIEEAESLKAQTQSHSERLADQVVPYSFLLSGLTYLFTGSAGRAAAVLLVDYSCAIKLSTPLVILTSLAKAANHRVLIKGGKYLETLAKADAFILDKTGTLTESAPEVVDVVPFNGFEGNYVLRQAACVEEHFPHPVATAVVRHAAEKGLHHEEEHAEVEYVFAHGIVSRVHGKRILVGSRHFVHEDEGVEVAMAEGVIEDFARKGYSILYVAMGSDLAGVVAIHDPLREEARSFVEELKKSGIDKVVMLTGDNEATARNVADQLGITEYRAQAFPEKKVEVIKELQEAGHTVAMVGDGINDSPALSHADVGISMKHGADIAKEACDVLLMEGTLADLLGARRMSQEAMDLIHENFRNIIAINSVAMLMALTGATPPVFSAVLHNMTTIGVGLRALKPLKRDKG